MYAFFIPGFKLSRSSILCTIYLKRINFILNTNNLSHIIYAFFVILKCRHTHKIFFLFLFYFSFITLHSRWPHFLSLLGATTQIHVTMLFCICERSLFVHGVRTPRRDHPKTEGGPMSEQYNIPVMFISLARMRMVRAHSVAWSMLWTN